jgi:hypothetical protein
MPNIDRLTLFLDDRDNRPLSSARIKDRIPAADRIRAAVQLWQQGGPVAERINCQAAELRRDRLTRDAAGGDRRIKVSVILGEVTHRALALARVEDGIPASERVRSALKLWQQDPEFRQAVDQLAAELRSQRIAERLTVPLRDHTAAPPEQAMAP